MEKKFSSFATLEGSPKWEKSIERQTRLPQKTGDTRSAFARDYQRILHNNAYGRLKHKTQVFFATQNDHICTRIEHVNHVSSVSTTIAKALGLNSELTQAIAIGHDLGHAPFGHVGETILRRLNDEKGGERFWHEKNSLHFVDDVIVLKDSHGFSRNLDLTYAVRDGIVCHCGEVDENALFPREEEIDLSSITKPGSVSPFTWEGCVVKLSDKIAYLGRDIEDAVTLGFLSEEAQEEFKEQAKKETGLELFVINNTALISHFVSDVCRNSSPVDGIRFSAAHLKLINWVKKFNYQNIYKHKRLDVYHRYAELILTSIFNLLSENFDGDKTVDRLRETEMYAPLLSDSFLRWLRKYGQSEKLSRPERYKNRVIYEISDYGDYHRAITDFISGMTDFYAIKIFDELTRF